MCANGVSSFAEWKIHRRIDEAKRASTRQIARHCHGHPRQEKRPAIARGQPASLGRDDVHPRPRVTQDLVDARGAEQQIERPGEYGGDLGGGRLGSIPLLVDVRPVPSA